MLDKQILEQFAQKIFCKKIEELDKKQLHVLKHFVSKKNISRNVNELFDSQLTFGQRLADKITSWGGSWRFIILCGTFLIFWIIINSFWLFLEKPFDPFPFILLNLFLSMLAAIQAPVIMMSQNRQNEKDRLNASLDYEINLKAELEIQELQEKLTRLMKERQKQEEKIDLILKKLG